MSKTIDALVEAALKRAFVLGQTYWQQADSDFTSNHKKAEATRQNFLVVCEETLAALAQARAEQAEPIDMVLQCPKCGVQHVDASEKNLPLLEAAEYGWDNPPHRSHLCHGCGHIWRPADVPTNGVAVVKTKGKADHPIATPPAAPVAKPSRFGSPELQTMILANLSTAPVAKLEPLTEDEIQSMCKQSWVYETAKQWVRAIEAAHNAKLEKR